jgi:signal transduction histidine kinase
MSKRPTDTDFATTTDPALTQKMASFKELNGRLLNLSQTISHNLSAYTANISMLVDLIDLDGNPKSNKSALMHLRTVSDDLSQTIAHLSQIIYVQSHTDIEKEMLLLKAHVAKIGNIVNGYGNENKLLFINKVPDDAMVYFNAGYLESILLNFSTNAVKYAHPDRFPRIAFDFFTEDGQQVLTITDNGLGIDLDRHGDELFGLYKTFHQHKESTGFGLYLSKYQIESMDAKVAVESKVGQSTTFKIFFSH